MYLHIRAIFNKVKNNLVNLNLKAFFNRKRLVAFFSAILLVFIISNAIEKEDSVVTTETVATEVEVNSVSDLAARATFDTIGKVEAISEANLQTESSGQITSVTVKVGDTVRAGAILATIENSTQRAALTQAQGSYEAAVAATAQSGVGLSESQTALTAANNSAVSTFRQANNTVNSVIRNNIDTFFSRPESAIPGLRLNGDGKTAFINNERIAYQQILPDFQTRSNNINADSDLVSELTYARAQVDRTIAYVDLFISILNRETNGDKYTEAEIQTLNTSFTSVRATLIGARASVDAALASLSGARDAVRRSELAASGGQVSVSDAQTKIALGSLQLAQAAYQKTIVRSPIQGVVNALYLKTGDYVTFGQPAGIVANNNGLQIKTFVSEIDSTNIHVGDTVAIEGGATGVVTAMAEALDPGNGKVAVVVGVDPDNKLTNGSTVQITFSQLSQSTTSDKILVPLSALKITANTMSVFTVGEDDTLIAIPVEKGQLYGESLEILSGITNETQIVTDARGLREGLKVTIKK
ncbi:MAG: HlyD family efflux transporter periplasmic adaptor subunit [Candidatus Pacebacteria bacterium]|nr:HlyD family efflux transporter periplasmic adaptor subunit [Candidatus Paceibacterota bacterium]